MCAWQFWLDGWSCSGHGLGGLGLLSAEGSLAAQLKVKQAHTEVRCSKMFFAGVGLVSHLELR